MISISCTKYGLVHSCTDGYRGLLAASPSGTSAPLYNPPSPREPIPIDPSQPVEGKDWLERIFGGDRSPHEPNDPYNPPSPREPVPEAVTPEPTKFNVEAAVDKEEPSSCTVN